MGTALGSRLAAAGLAIGAARKEVVAGVNLSGTEYVDSPFASFQKYLRCMRTRATTHVSQTRSHVPKDKI